MLAGLLIVLVTTAVYLVSLRVHPYRKCRACGTSGRHESRDRKKYGNCWRCRDRTLTRLGVRVLMPRMRGEIEAGRHGRFH